MFYLVELNGKMFLWQNFKQKKIILSYTFL